MPLLIIRNFKSFKCFSERLKYFVKLCYAFLDPTPEDLRRVFKPAFEKNSNDVVGIFTATESSWVSVLLLVFLLGFWIQLLIYLEVY